MLGETGVTVDDVRLPQNGREVLGSASNGGHGECLSLIVVVVVEVVLALPEIYEFGLIVAEQEEVGGLDVPVADAPALQEGAGGDEAAVHADEFSL